MPTENEGTTIQLQNLWAKSNPFKQLLAHMLDAGNCVRAYLLSPSSMAVLAFLKDQWHLDTKANVSFVSYLAALHDIGKAMPQFQYQTGQSIRHEYYSARIMTSIWKQKGQPSRLYQPYAYVLALHHQRIENERIRTPVDETWQAVQTELEVLIRDAFHAPAALPRLDNMNAVCILLTGLTILCDWVASSGPFNGIRLLISK